MRLECVDDLPRANLPEMQVGRELGGTDLIRPVARCRVIRDRPVQKILQTAVCTCFRHLPAICKPDMPVYVWHEL
jgi:hypothetical protein